MAQRFSFVLPCLTAAGLLAACATPPGGSLSDMDTPADEVDLASLAQPNLHYRRPAVPPLEGPESPLLALGLVKPIPRPQTQFMIAGTRDRDNAGAQLIAQAETGEAVESPSDAVRVEIAPILFAPRSEEVNLAVEVAAAKIDLPKIVPVVDISETLFVAQTAGIDLPLQIAAAHIDLPAGESFEIAGALLGPPQPIELALNYSVAVTLPPAPTETAAAELERRIATGLPLTITPVTALELNGVGQASGETAAAAPPAPRPRQEKLTAAIRARSEAQKALAEGGPELSFELRR